MSHEAKSITVGVKKMPSSNSMAKKRIPAKNEVTATIETMSITTKAFLIAEYSSSVMGVSDCWFT